MDRTYPDTSTEDLNETNLIKALSDMREYTKKTGKKLSIKPRFALIFLSDDIEGEKTQ